MINTVSLFLLFLLLLNSVGAFPTPIERPKITIVEASDKALGHHKEKYEAADIEPFAVKVIYGKLEVSLASAGYPLRRPERLNELREKTGWFVQILRSPDLSQSDLYFIDQNLKIEHILSTI